MKKKRRKPSWRKFVVDGKVLSVYPSSREPKEFTRLSSFHGVQILPATREERKPFLHINAKVNVKRLKL